MKVRVIYNPRYFRTDAETRYVDVERVFTVQVGKSDYTMFVHRVVDRRAFFECSDFITGTGVARGDFDSVDLAEAAGRRRVQREIAIHGEENTRLRIETTHFDGAINEIPADGFKDLPDGTGQRPHDWLLDGPVETAAVVEEDDDEL